MNLNVNRNASVDSKDKVDELIKEIQENYETNNIGHSLYKRLMGIARELQVS